MNDGHAVVANLGDIFTGDGHCVLIYAVEKQNFKIKDSHGVKYKIPIDRPDFYQVFAALVQFLPLLSNFSGSGDEGYR